MIFITLFEVQFSTLQIEDLSSNAQIAAAEKFQAPGASVPKTKETEQDTVVENEEEVGEDVSDTKCVMVIS